MTWILGTGAQVPPSPWITAAFVRHWLLKRQRVRVIILYLTFTWFESVVVSLGTAPVGGGLANNPLTLEGCPLLMSLLGVACPPTSVLPGIGTARVPGIGTSRLGTTSS